MKKVRINENQLRKVITKITEDVMGNNPEQTFLPFVDAQLKAFDWIGESANIVDMYDINNSFYSSLQPILKEKFFNFLINKMEETPELQMIQDEMDLITTYDSKIEEMFNLEYTKNLDKIVKYIDSLKQERDDEEAHMNYLRNNSYKW